MEASAPDDDNRGVYELTNGEKALVVKYAELGLGFVLPVRGAPKSVTNLSVIEEVEAIKMSFTSSQEVRDEVTISYTRTAAANASNGWTDVSVSGESPWVTGGVQAHFQESSFESMSEGTVYFSGRHHFSQCKVTLPLDLEPNSDFDKAVHAALDHPDEAARTKALQEVFDTWGHIFLVSVEMGGLKHVSMQTLVTKKEEVASFEADAKVALGSRFVHVQGDIGGVSNTTTSVGKVMEKMNLDTVGGIPHETDLVKWAESVNSFRNWRVTRKLAVRSVVTLFDEETQAKILAAQPADPAADAVTLFRIYCGKHHFYTTSGSERNATLQWYRLEQNAARIFTCQKAGTVPLFRFFCPESGDHIYTISDIERTTLISSGQWNDEGQAGFVYASQAPGTVPLYRVYRPGAYDHLYTTDNAEQLTAVHKYHDTPEGISCYVYKA